MAPLEFAVRCLLNRALRSAALAIAALPASVLTAPMAAAVTLGQLDDFQDGTTQQWVAGLGISSPPVPPANVPTGGPAGAGDAFLRITAGGLFGAGTALVVNNDSPAWTGNYTAAGVTEILLDANNDNAFDLTVRLGFDGTGGRFVTDGVLVPSATGWQSLTFAVEAGDLLADPNLPRPGTNAVATLAGVTVIRVLHNGVAVYRGARVTGTLDLDNIETVPEPSLDQMLPVLMLALGLIGRFR